MICSNRRTQLNTIAAIALYVLILPTIIFGSVTGKIKGRVTDAETGEPITGVNVMLEGTYLGASTDLNGEYYILQIAPGTYKVRFSIIGYEKYTVQDVRVLVDLTTILDAEIGTENLIGDEVLVTATRPLIQADDASSTIYLSSEELAKLPVSSAAEALMLQSGVFQNPASNMYGGSGEESFSIRGGSQGQIKLYLDGVRNSSLMGAIEASNVGFSSLNLHGVSELQIITSGFSAEYGEAQSGVVNAISKTGGTSYSGSFELIQSPAGKRHFGRNIYDYPTQEEYLSHLDENGKVDSAWFSSYDKSFRSHIDSTGLMDSLWMIPHREQQMYDYTLQEDYTLYYSFGGPFPGLKDRGVSFFVSGQSERKATILPRPRDTHNLNTVQANLRLPVGVKANLLLTGSYSFKEFSTLQGQGLYNNSAKFYRGYGSIRDAKNVGFSFHWNHTLLPELFYELKVSTFQASLDEYMGEYSPLGSGDTEQSIWKLDYYFIPEEYTQAQADSMRQEPYHMYTPRVESLTETGDISTVGNLTWQMDKYNQIKTGFEFRQNHIQRKGNYRLPPWTDNIDYYWNRGLEDDYKPIQIAAYVRDKMEFESMIMEVGLRFDRFDPNREWFAFSHWFNPAINPEYDINLDEGGQAGDQVDSLGNIKYSFDNILDKPMTEVDAFEMLSPRIGISFPISENSKLAFNYGHFYQTPAVDKMFELNYFRPNYITEGIYANDTSGNSDAHFPSLDGDPERVIFLTVEALKPQKTVQFEVKYEQVIQRIAKVSFTGYFKDITDQTYPRPGLFSNRVYGWDPFNNRTTITNFYVGNFPGDFGDARGLEINLRTLFSQNMSFDFNYAFSAMSSGKASPDEIHIDSDSTITYSFSPNTPSRIESLNRPHLFRTNIFLAWPKAWEANLLGMVFRNVDLSLLYQAFSGSPYLYQLPEDDSDFLRTGRLESTQTWDMKVNKGISIGSSKVLASFKVTNLFNRKNHRAIGDEYYDANADNYYRKHGEPKTVDGGGYDIAWLVYGTPRQYYFSLKYEF